jgi:ribose/xylose/arabinose/galactoside ABC-type transport system permease subunit
MNATTTISTTSSLPTFGERLRLIAARREYGLAIVLALIIASVTIKNPSFLSAENIRDILIHCTQPLIVSCGVMLVIVTGEIDISVGSALALLTAILGWLASPTHFHWPAWAAILVTLSAGAFIGLVNGLLVTLVRIPSIIVTLGMFTMLRGLSVILMKPGDITDMPYSVRFFGIGRILGISTSLWITAIVVVATALLITFTPLGRRIYAVGSNPHAARLSGLSVTRIKIFVFVFTGFLVGVATIVTQLATVTSGLGQGFELLVVTCVVVGGVSISGGVGTIAGVVLGVILLQIQSTVLIFLKLGTNSANWNQAIQGALILIAVLVDHVARGRGKIGSGH